MIAAIDRCADEVAADRNGAALDRETVAAALQRGLESRGIFARLPRVLSDAVDATDRALPASPVPAPPYVVVTGRGPMLRASLGSGRLVIRFDAFDVVREPEPGYERRDGTRVTVSLE